jgi:hypothetical protein
MPRKKKPDPECDAEFEFQFMEESVFEKMFREHPDWFGPQGFEPDPQPNTEDVDHVVLASTLHTQRTSYISGAHDRWPFRDWLRLRIKTLDNIRQINNTIAARKTKITFL